MPSIKELEDSLSAEQRKSTRSQEEAKILRSLYEKLINKVKTDDPARFDQAAYHQVRAHLQGLVTQNQQGLKPNDKILKDIVGQAIKDRHAELEAVFDTCVNEAVEEKLTLFKEEYQQKLEDDITKELDEKIKGLVVRQVEARLRQRSGELEAIFAQTVDEQVLLKLEPAKARLELDFRSRLQAKFDEALPALLEERVRGRVIELRAEIESELQGQYHAKLSARLGGVLADRLDNESAMSTLPMAAPPNPGPTIERLEATIRDLGRQLRAKTTEAESATANFEALERQITQKDDAVVAEREKTKEVQRALEAEKSKNVELEEYIQEIEERLKVAEDFAADLGVELKTAKGETAKATRKTSEVEQKLVEFRDNNLAEKTVTSLLTEQKELAAKVVELETEIATLKVEKAELPKATVNCDKEKALIRKLKDQLHKLRGEMPKFDLRPHAYDIPIGSISGQNLDSELSSDIDTNSIRSESVGGERRFEDEEEKFNKGKFEEEDSDKEEIEEEKRDEVKSEVEKSAEGRLDDGSHFTPEPVYIWGPVRIVERPMTIASHNPFRCWFETELATFLIGATLLFRFYYKIQSAFGQGTPQTPPQGPPRHGNTSTGDEDFGDDQDAPPAPPMNDMQYASSSEGDQDSGNDAPPPPSVATNTVLSSASWNPAFRPNSFADIKPETNTAATDPMSYIPDLSDDDFPDTRMPMASGSAPNATLSRALFSNMASAPAFGAAANTHDIGSGEQEQRRILNLEDLANFAEDENDTDDDRPRMKSGEEALREAANIPLPASPKNPNSHRPPTQHVHPSFSPPPSKTFWEEAADQSRTLLSKATLFTVLSLLVHLTFYGLALVLWQTWVTGNVWKLANESTRKATQHLLFAGRGGQGQSWWHWVISEKWASGIDYMLYRGLGGELIAYRMPG